ncbi:MAG: hypothetical protein JZU64_10835 [Rhodoferax sp.]|nr:hypothetical protein [Rhodoferax sp.]
MKRKTIFYLAAVLLGLLLVPLVNLPSLARPRLPAREPWWDASRLYNIDFLMAQVSRVLYHAGISTDPAQVIIGKNHWLYLGDTHGEGISVKRRQPGIDDEAVNTQIAAVALAWEYWFKGQGVRLYRVLLAPDKSSVYPEFLPDWAQPRQITAIDGLLKGAHHSIYVDSRAALAAAKTEFAEALYPPNNTHWNALGAWAGFRQLGQSMRLAEPGLRWPADSQLRVVKAEMITGGDLASFLRMGDVLQDRELTTEVSTGPAIETRQTDFESGQLLLSGGNPRVGAPQTPVLVTSTQALNQRRVLWLRDSFGVAMSPYMAATFTETLQLHYSAADPALVARLVAQFKPDYVLVSVVERDARSAWFTRRPPG